MAIEHFADALEAWRHPALPMNTVTRLTGLRANSIEYLGSTSLTFANWRTGRGHGRRFTAEEAWVLRVVGASSGIIPPSQAVSLAEPAQGYAALWLTRPELRDRPASLAGYPVAGRRDWQWALVLDGRWPEGAAPGPVMVRVAVGDLLLLFVRDLVASAERAGLPPPIRAVWPRLHSLAGRLPEPQGARCQ